MPCCFYFFDHEIKVLVASNVRYDLAIRDSACVCERVMHPGGYLKIAQEHTAASAPAASAQSRIRNR